MNDATRAMDLNRALHELEEEAAYGGGRRRVAHTPGPWVVSKPHTLDHHSGRLVCIVPHEDNEA